MSPVTFTALGVRGRRLLRDPRDLDRPLTGDDTDHPTIARSRRSVAPRTPFAPASLLLGEDLPVRRLHRHAHEHDAHSASGLSLARERAGCSFVGGGGSTRAAAASSA